MYLKRHYHQDSLVEGATPRVSHVEVRHTGLNAEQNFKRRLVLQAMSDGWMKISGATLTVIGEPEDLVYQITREPGYYCTSTGERIQISALAWEQATSQPAAILASVEAKAWLEANGKEPGDYEVTMAYECTLNAEQHTKFRAVRDPASNTVAAYTIAGA